MEAMLYQKEEAKTVRCGLCHHRCRIRPGKRGRCHVRENRDGRLVSLVYDRIISRNIDPIEKKPMFHMAPGSLSYSIATVGCNLRCRFCQNADIAQMPTDREGLIMGNHATPEEIVEDACRNGCRSIAYTYTEPTVYFELAYATARLAAAAGLLNVFVTNGFMTPEAIDRIAPFLDGANVDLKAYSDRFYREYCSAALEPVRQSLQHMKAAGIFVEITTLLIPGCNDDRNELKRMAAFIANDLGRETPWHLSRFHPTYRMTDRPPTPLRSLMEARAIGLAAGLRYVYTGNVPGDEGGNTYCYSCGERLVERFGFSISANRIKNGCCPHCDTHIDGIEMG